MEHTVHTAKDKSPWFTGVSPLPFVIVTLHTHMRFVRLPFRESRVIVLLMPTLVVEVSTGNREEAEARERYLSKRVNLTLL